MRTDTQPSASVLLGIALISAAALSYEVVLVRLFSIVHWHHFAYMIISLALLGFGMSGTILSLFGEKMQRHFYRVVWISAAGFAAAALVCTALAEAVQFNALELIWDLSQWPRLVLVYLLLAVPFVFAATCIGLSFMKFNGNIGLVYGADMLGAGLGAVIAVFLLSHLYPSTLVGVLAVLALAGGLVIIVSSTGLERRTLTLVTGLLMAGGLLLFAQRLEIAPSPYKSLSQSMQTIGARVLAERSGPLGLLAVVENREVPLRVAPGMSFSAPASIPPQLALFSDGEFLGPITDFPADPKQIEYLSRLPTALPYELGETSKVAILGSGGGSDVLQALFYEVDSVDAVEANGQLLELVRDRFHDAGGRIYADPRVSTYVEDARAFMERTAARYDVIQIGPIDGFGGGTAGLRALSETYLYTEEALTTYLQRLKSEGMLSMSRWVRVPPREDIKLFATAIQALRNLGVEDPARHLLWVRSWNLSNLVVKRTPLTSAQIELAKAFCASRGFDMAYYAGMTAQEANRHHRLQQPFFFQAANELLRADAESFVASYKFDIRPTSDDRPYFFKFFRWKTLPEIFALRAAGGAGLADLGYLVLVACLLQAVLLSVLLLVLPLWIRRRIKLNRGRYLLAFFTLLGLGFMGIEIAFIQKFVRFLAHPIYAYAAMLAGFLICAGLGSIYANRLQHRDSPVYVARIVAAMILFAVVCLLIIDHYLQAYLTSALVLKMALSIAVISPLAFMMGMPFPLGLHAVAVKQPAAVPWAWAVNGCASVCGAVIALLFAMHFGLRALVLISLALYVLAWLSLRGYVRLGVTPR